MPRLRVLIVEDSLTVRQRLHEVLAGDPDIEVVGQAVNGQEAVDMCLALRPDVITMDMMLPVMSGLVATEQIMAHRPTPILVVSALDRQEMFKTFDALKAGAVEVLQKPGGDGSEPDEAWAARLISTVKLVARIRVITHLRAKLPSGSRVQRHASLAIEPSTQKTQLLVLGASTGGPGALVRILSALPAPLKLPLLIVQHIGEDFGMAFADWLGTQTPHRTRYARDGEAWRNTAGEVVLAPPGVHLIMNQSQLALSDAPAVHSCKPAIDLLFHSIATNACASATVAGLLTGMGRDGAQGLLNIRRAGGQTIAQDEATSSIYGMPREAAQLGAAQHVLPLDDIGPWLAARMVQAECETPGKGERVQR
jgi:two-component system chemotaxis response regulator CheB